MSNQFDFKKEWESTKKTLMQLSKDAAVIAKKGETELVKISEKGKLHFDSTANIVKKEHLYLQIGKEFVTSKKAVSTNTKLKKLVAQVNKIEKEQKALKRAMKTKKKKTVKS